MTDWVAIGSRFINLSTVCEVCFDAHTCETQVHYVSGESTDLTESEARELQTALLGRSTMLGTPRGSMFTYTRPRQRHRPLRGPGNGADTNGQNNH